MRAAENDFKIVAIENLISSAHSSDMGSIYGQMKTRGHSGTLDVGAFAQHCRKLFSSCAEPELIRLQSCQLEKHPVLHPFSIEEVDASVEKMKSKAKSTTGFSPFVLKRLAANLMPFLSGFSTTLCSHQHSRLNFWRLRLFFSTKKARSRIRTITGRLF